MTTRDGLGWRARGGRGDNWLQDGQAGPRRRFHTFFVFVVVGGMLAVFILMGLMASGQFGRRKNK